MSEELDVLRKIGAQKICEDTHISLKHVQSVIHESFEGLTKVQFLGFVSILEREYEQDLSALRAKGLEYFNDTSFKGPEQSSVFIETKRAKPPTLLYALIALFVFVVVAYMSIDSTTPTELPVKVDNTTIESVQKNLDPIVVDENLSAVEMEEEKAPEIVPSLKIIPKSKLWIGYIDRQEEIKKQAVIKTDLDLDPNKEWLLSLGHGNVDIEINGEVQKFKTSNNIRFLYKDGDLRKLTSRDFKILNEGRVW